MRNLRIVIFCLLASAAMLACNKKTEKEVVGLRPIYATTAALEKIENIDDQSLEAPGKIYVYENLLLINDKNKGIHIYDNANTKNPVHLSFVSIPGNMDFSVRNDMIYADNITDLVVLDISQASNPKFVNRVKSVFPSQKSPPQTGFFECVDASKGVVLGWEEAVLINPNCVK
ncbi:MAG: hypothetical protein AB8B72_10215 [Crocinitomicaceae bacterium]